MVRLLVFAFAVLNVLSCSKDMKTRSPQSVDEESPVVEGTISHLLNIILPVAYADEIEFYQPCRSECVDSSEKHCIHAYMIKPDGSAADKAFCSAELILQETINGIPQYSYRFEFKNKEMRDKHLFVPILIRATLPDSTIRESIIELNQSARYEANVDPSRHLYTSILKEKFKESQKTALEHLREFKKEFSDADFKSFLQTMGLLQDSQSILINIQSIFRAKQQEIENLFKNKKTEILSYINKKKKGESTQPIHDVLGVSELELGNLRSPLVISRSLPSAPRLGLPQFLPSQPSSTLPTIPNVNSPISIGVPSINPPTLSRPSIVTTPITVTTPSIGITPIAPKCVMGPFAAGDPCSGIPNVDSDGDKYLDAVDCAPEDPLRWQKIQNAYVDLDGDGFLNLLSAPLCLGSVTISHDTPAAKDIDCDDTDPSKYTQHSLNFIDKDNDGFYLKLNSPYVSCANSTPPAGYATENKHIILDCDDQDPSLNKRVEMQFMDKDNDGWTLSLSPARKICTSAYNPAPPYKLSPGKGQDCDDNDLNKVPVTFYKDNDGDGVGGTDALQTCANPQQVPSGYSLVGGDYEDYIPSTNLWKPYEREPRVLVLYNENLTKSKELALYYVQKRKLPSETLCGLRMTSNPYTTYEEFKGAKKRIIEECLCKQKEIQEKFSACDLSQLENLDKEILLDAVVMIKGLPYRVTSHHEDPSLGYLLQDELFRYSTTIEPKTRIYWGNLEGITFERARAHFDRSMLAEENGFKGNIFTEHQSLNAFGDKKNLIPPHGATTYAHSLTGLEVPRNNHLENPCIEDGYNARPWDPNRCRVFSTYDGKVPGSSSHFNNPTNAGLFIGTNYGPNGQGAFNSRLSHLLAWKKDFSNCKALCSEFTDEASREECRNNSLDYLKQINTSCVGGSQNFMGYQYRSWTVQQLGLYPLNWFGPGDGQVEYIAPEIVSSPTAFSSEQFPDNKYLRLSIPALDDSAYCEDSSGSKISCFTTVPVLLSRNLGPHSPHRNEDGSVDLTVKIKYRGPAQPEGARLPISITGAASVGDYAIFNLPTEGTQGNWITLEDQIKLPASLPWSSPTSIYLDLGIRAGFESKISHWIELDAIEIIDSQGTPFNLPVGLTSFSESQEATLESPLNLAGDWATVAIERMGAIAWWGSSSHYLTGGHAFAYTADFMYRFFRGFNLGSSLASVRRANTSASGLIFGDPLLRLSTAAIMSNNDYSYTQDPYLGTEPTLKLSRDPRLGLNPKLKILAYHGLGKLDLTTWELSYCNELENSLRCTQANSWKTLKSGKASLTPQNLNSGENFLLDLLPQNLQTGPLHLRLKVVQDNKDSEAIYDHRSFDYISQPTID